MWKLDSRINVEGWEADTVLHLWLMLGRVGNGCFRCLTDLPFIYIQGFAKFRCCFQFHRPFNLQLVACMGWASGDGSLLVL